MPDPAQPAPTAASTDPVALSVMQGFPPPSEKTVRAAEAAWQQAGGEAPVYVIGTEVPVPGGATEALDHLATAPARGDDDAEVAVGHVDALVPRGVDDGALAPGRVALSS